MDFWRERHNETIDIHYLNSGVTNNMNLSFITRIGIPIPGPKVSSTHFQAPVFAFSSDGSKFAMATRRGRVSVWDIRSKVPLKTFILEVPKYDYGNQPVQRLQFSSGKLGKEVLAFVEVCLA